MENHLIIGASSGIGLALAQLLKSQGKNVYCTYNSNALQEDSNTKRFDVLNNSFDPDFLPDNLDGFVYCPGSIDLKPFTRLEKDDILNDVRLQVIGAVEVLQKVLPRLKAAGQASVVFFSTVAVSSGFNYHSQVAISKGAIEGLARSLSAEFAPNIRVNVIAPSLTDTPLAARLLNSDLKRESNAERHPLKRLGTAIDIAESAAFLLSDKSSWMTGQVLHVDGGMSSIRS